MSERALILCDEIGIFLAVARSLGRRGIEVHAVPWAADAPGLASRHIAALRSLPPYRADPRRWAEALRTLADAEDYGLILPCADADLAILDHHAETIGRARLALPNREALDAFADKGETRALAERLGVAVAEGGPIAPDMAAAELAARLGLPLVLKPRRSYRLGARETKLAARIVGDRAELERALADGLDENWLAEAFFAGEGVGVSVLAREGRILLAWQHRRLKAVSATGASSARKSEPLDPRLVRAVEALAGATALTGIAMFEFRQDPASGRHVLLEVNPRFWGSLPLALAAGADFPALLWDLHKGREPAVGEVQRRGVARTSLTGECDRIAAAVEQASGPAEKARALLAAAGFAATLPFARRFDGWAADDPAPYRAERRQVIARLAGRFTGRRFGKAPTRS